MIAITLLTASPEDDDLRVWKHKRVAIDRKELERDCGRALAD
ncbi:MAG: hypothetical protein H6Q89_4215 [Myxococcaceae bacterium]|nr:hypothetical protein [Myxococcaceae bacterium]